MSTEGARGREGERGRRVGRVFEAHPEFLVSLRWWASKIRPTLRLRSSILAFEDLAEEGMNGGGGQLSFAGSRAVADEQRSVAGLDGGQSVAAAHQGRIQRHHVEQGAKAKLLLHQAKERP